MAGKGILNNLQTVDMSYLLDPTLADEDEQDVTAAPSEKAAESLPIDQLTTFKNHPFHVYTDTDDFEQLVESIQELGVVTPVLVRPMEAQYEIISGHRRVAAAKQAGLKEVPVIVRVLSDYEATLLMVHSNIYRPEISISEKARAYRMCRDAETHQGIKGTDTAAMVGKDQDSRRQVYRYIRLSYLLDDFLELVDNKKLPINTAVEVAYLDTDSQEALLKYIDRIHKYPTSVQAAQLRKIYEENNAPLTYEKIVAELTEIPKEKKVNKVTFKTKDLAAYFEEGTDTEHMENVILNLLSRYKNGEFSDLLEE